MTQIIYKHTLEYDHIGERAISLSKGATILTAQVQKCSINMRGWDIQLWVLEELESDIQENRVIEVVVENMPVDMRERKYISTVQSPNGKFVFHIFEIV